MEWLLLVCVSVAGSVWFQGSGPTCPPRCRRFHVAVGHFGEGVQLLHQTQGFPSGQTPHLSGQDGFPNPPNTKCV